MVTRYATVLYFTHRRYTYSGRHCHGLGKPVTRAGTGGFGYSTGRHSATYQKPIPGYRYRRYQFSNLGLTFNKSTLQL